MSMIQAIRDYIAKCPILEVMTGGIDFTEADPDNYGIFPTGEQILQTYLDKSRRKQYTFAIYAKRFTVSDLERLENNEFVERFADWIEEQNDLQNYPEFPAGYYIESISCANGVLFDIDETGDTGLYRIPCQLIYTKRRQL